MNKKIRQLFEEHTVPSFGPFDGDVIHNERGEYMNPAIEDHWQTFQEAAEVIIKQCAEIADRAEPYQTSDLILKHFGVK